MKQISLFIASCLFANFSFAQEFPGYGTVSSEEINFKQCSFDKDANAVVLLHEAYSDYDDMHHLVTVHHVRIKILKEKGIAAADISIPFYRKDDYEQIDMIEGMTINANAGGQVVNTSLERKSIFTKKNTERFGEVVFAFPAVKPGSIIDYKYRSTMRDYGGLQDWDFQERLPILISRYTLVILPNAEFAYRVNKSDEFPIILKKDDTHGSAYFEMDSIPGLGDEPYMDARRDYLQSVIFQLSGFDRYGNGKSNYMTSWDEVTRELLSSPDFGGQLNKNLSGTDDFVRQTKNLALPEDKMKAVFNYVRANVNWNDLYSKYVVDGVKNAWLKKSGSSGDVNLLLVNLLKQVSLDAYPMLVSERFHGRVNAAYPFIDQFNSVFACVLINDKKYYLDATDKSVPPQLTPFNILNTTAFIVNRKNGGLVNITNDTAQYKEDILVDLAVADNGSLTGSVSVKSADYARIKKLDEYKGDQKKFLDRHFIVGGTAIVAKDLELSNIDNDSIALEQHCRLSGNLTTTGNYSFVPLNLFTGFDQNPFISDNRFSNINFGYRRTVNLTVSIALPAGYVVDEKPPSVKLTTPDKDILFIRQIEYDQPDNMVRCMIQFAFKKSLYDRDEYGIIKEVYRKLFDYLKEPIVLKRK